MTSNQPAPNFPQDIPLGNHKGLILIIDDTPHNIQILSEALSQQGYEVRGAVNSSMSLISAKHIQPDLILLDIKMPDIDGYEVCRQLKADPSTADIPVIFISALDDALDKVKAFAVGGVDYVTKPFQFAEVLARVENQLMIGHLQNDLRERNQRLQQEVQERMNAEATVQQLNAELEERVLQRTAQLNQKMMELEQAQKQLHFMAMHDPLTRLPNRTYLMERLKEVFHQAQHSKDAAFAVLFLDCDRFKIVNDSLGHFIGDQFLQAISHRLQTCLPPGAILARFGGDEFTILIEEVLDVETAAEVAMAIQRNLSDPFEIASHEFFITASIGIVHSQCFAYEQPMDVLRDADTAMYRAKALGTGSYEVFAPSMHADAQSSLSLDTDLRRATEREEFVLFYQPIVSLQTGHLMGFEALIRWQHPHKGMVSPGRFIPIAEETGLIVPIGRWVLHEACRQFKIWQDRNMMSQALQVCVNLSVKQFSQPDLIDQIDASLRHTGLDSRCLKIEITESAIMQNSVKAAEILEELRARHIQLSIDDFGTGYSSLSYLHNFPVNTLKIDRSFINSMGHTTKTPTIVEAIITLAQNLGMDVIAEGIEMPQQRDRLRALDCTYGQGYLFSPPIDALAAETLMSIQDLRLTGT